MTADGIVPSLLLLMVSVFGGAWARNMSRQQAEMREEVHTLRDKYETDARANVGFQSEARTRIRALEQQRQPQPLQA